MGAIFLSLLKLAESLPLWQTLPTVLWVWPFYDHEPHMIAFPCIPNFSFQNGLFYFLSLKHIWAILHCGRPSNSPWKISMSPPELVNITLHGKRHLEDMTELRIIQWEDYPDSPDGLNVVTLLRCHQTEWRWCWDRMSTGPSYYWEPPLVAGGSSLMQCLNFWTGGIELTSHRFLGRISGPPCLWATQDPLNQDRHCFCAISYFPGSTLPDIQSFPKRTTRTWLWLSQEILHVLPASFCCRRWTIWQGDNDWVGSQESDTGSNLHSTACIDYKNMRSYWEKTR